MDLLQACLRPIGIGRRRWLGLCRSAGDPRRLERHFTTHGLKILQLGRSVFAADQLHWPPLNMGQRMGIGYHPISYTIDSTS